MNATGISYQYILVTFYKIAYLFQIDVILDIGKFCVLALGVSVGEGWVWGVMKERGCCYECLPKPYMMYSQEANEES